jgi:hypothetical protein
MMKSPLARRRQRDLSPRLALAIGDSGDDGVVHDDESSPLLSAGHGLEPCWLMRPMSVSLSV